MGCLDPRRPSVIARSTSAGSGISPRASTPIENARRGYAALAFALSFTGQSDGEVPDVASPDIYTQDFRAAVAFLGLQDIVYRERIGLHAICGLSGMALTAAAAVSRIKAVATSSMNDMSRSYLSRRR
ncbi:alpha/beta hydrolase [Streptomyces sp. YH02]|uniref:alpha/beta hydrolase n=1 Tax=Streptomyces sp. YH02 TaxID=3256999 RepID=UPI0037566BF8